MQFVTSGLPKIPTELTKQAIKILSFHEIPEIQREYFVLQVVSIGFDQHATSGGLGAHSGFKKHVKKNLKKPYQSSTIEVSDGIATTTAIIQRDIYDDMLLNDQQITPQCVIVIKGDIFRQRCDVGKTGFIFNEPPRMVLNDVEGVIGDPLPLVKALKEAKYEDIAAKYPEGHFRIPYTHRFFNQHISRANPPTSNREYSLQLMDRISDLPVHMYKNRVLFPALSDTSISLMILSYAWHLHRARTLLKRLSRVAFNLATSSETFPLARDDPGRIGGAV